MNEVTIGGGCFWCLEAVYLKLDGVLSVVSGYAGGQLQNPSYEEVTSGTTGHAEVVRIQYDPNILSFEDILEVFWIIHDPTTPNRQGNDTGPQYRSIILYHNEEQKIIAEKSIKALTESSVFHHPVVTEIVALDTFYPAEDYHQNYFDNNPGNPYCLFVVKPKVDKFLNYYQKK